MRTRLTLAALGIALASAGSAAELPECGFRSVFPRAITFSDDGRHLYYHQPEGTVDCRMPSETGADGWYVVMCQGQPHRLLTGSTSVDMTAPADILVFDSDFLFWSCPSPPAVPPARPRVSV